MSRVVTNSVLTILVLVSMFVAAQPHAVTGLPGARVKPLADHDGVRE